MARTLEWNRSCPAAARVALLIIAVAMRSPVAHAATHTVEIEETLPLTSGETLSLKTPNGDVTVEPWEGGDVVIRATKRITALTAALAASISRRVEVRIVRTAEGVDAEVEGWGLPVVGKVAVDYRVRVPAAWQGRMEVRTSNGDVTIQRLHADADIKTSNGAVRIDGHIGAVRALTSNGSIDVIASAASLQAETSNGRVHVRESLLSGAGYLRSSNRGIEVDAALAPGSSYEVETSNGPIDLFLADPNVRLDLSTNRGSIEVGAEVAVIRADEHQVVGQIGDGAAKLVAVTSNGDIRLVRAGRTAAE